MKVFHILFYILSLLLPGAVSTLAAPGPVSIILSPARDTISVGDSLTVFCDITSAPDIQIKTIGLDQSSNTFDIENQWTVPSGNQDTQGKTRIAFLLYVFAPDTLVVGPVVSSYETAGGDSSTIASNTLVLPVTSSVDTQDAQLQPNRAPVSIQSQGIPLWIILLFALIFLCIAVVLIRFYLKSKKTVIEPVIPVDEIGEFERIRDLNLPGDGKIKEHYLMLSHALRAFIYRNMNFDARSETTYEINRHLNNAPFEDSIRNEIASILQESDMVKFAKFTPSHDLVRSAVDRALHPVKSVLDEINRLKTLEESQHETDENQATTETAPSKETNSSGEDH